MHHFTHSKVSKNDQDHSENVKLQETPNFLWIKYRNPSYTLQLWALSQKNTPQRRVNTHLKVVSPSWPETTIGIP